MLTGSYLTLNKQPASAGSNTRTQILVFETIFGFIAKEKWRHGRMDGMAQRISGKTEMTSKVRRGDRRGVKKVRIKKTKNESCGEKKRK